ncbi:hypothetical protein TSOC_006363 [Tetrabaena socialis]|uniref:Uncharacterized protein n=1 Tax=Tetrabaena socialis TaxID=47790 RepID=A0A2J8A3W3_9CHLO|nr:hypothetical protein TSOC_006363 [Tetrabaena socialis]|eukprot:PNH07193.1 hypothetical protein TSOC_006363 [Tetrabaena socialis]
MGEDSPVENLRNTNAVRVEKTRHEGYCRDRSAMAIEPYLSQINTYKARTRPLDQSRLLQDPNVQDWAALTGTRRSLATNITDAGPHVNVNKIRYKRDADYCSTVPYDGGPTYNSEVCIDNWVQERRDKTFKSEGGTWARSIAPAGSSAVLEGNVPLIHESERTQRVRDGLLATNTFERTWKTMYQTEHKDYSRRPATVA